MGENFNKIKIGAMFQTKDGTTYRKLNDLVAEDVTTGIERYIEPLFDKSIGVDDVKPDVDTSARVVKEPVTTEPVKKARKKTKK